MNERIKELREQAWALVSNEERDRGELYEARKQWERCDQKFAELVRADEREAIYDEWWSCVMSDLENGVKSLNEKAAVEWHKNYPAQSKMFPEWIETRSNT